ncbi:ATPase [Desulfovibrio porci]|uniref:ATPase n=1 Tax=Desulfovibrio porci TaxID=2605782 RepID=UPI0018A6CECE|nr:ATPase [Desulfovibrio porci]
MSHRSPSAASQPQSSPFHSSKNPELAQRIERFHEAAQDLLAMYEPPEQGRENIPHPTQNGETRCYYLSPGTVQHERELLRRYRAEDFRGLLRETHMLLVGLVKVMKNTHHDVRVKGYVIANLGCLLEQVSALVLRMKNVYNKVESVN